MANEKFQRRKKRNFCQQGKTAQKEQRSRLLSSIDYSGRRLENLFRSVKPNNARLSQLYLNAYRFVNAGNRPAKRKAMPMGNHGDGEQN
ncbi:hypothetical protein T07_11015 [Trichinella nelsoni]|uniref:Uncharacterized protein n=1 Tax=Trichinella nelsoni TaxID=6336 RepID=A0A0V0S4D0_9BILA|nr:hypothetical protein T07_11015 [Trichinella nelsoni]